MATDNNLTINDLHDYCILNILKFLPFRDKIIFATVSENLRRVFFLHLRTNREVYLDFHYYTWSLHDIQIAFKLIGKMIEEFEFVEKFDFIPRGQTCLDFLLEYCNNLKVLQLNDLQNSQIITPEIGKRFQHLENLKFYKASLIDADIRQLTKLKNIKILDLSENHEITGSSMEKFGDVQILRLNYCSNLQKFSLINVFRQFTNLTTLEMEHSSLITNSIMGLIIDSCKLLECLKLRIIINKDLRSQNWIRLNELKKLKILALEENGNHHGAVELIPNYRNIINNVLISLSEQLEYLKIHFTQIDHDKGYNIDRFNAIYKLKKLKELHLVGYLSCYVINWNDLTDFINDSNVKIVTCTHTNSMLDFAEAYLIDFLENRSSKLDEFQIIYPNTFVHMPFFYKFLEQLALYEPIFQTKFTLQIKVSEPTRQAVLRRGDYLATAGIYNLVFDCKPSPNLTSYYGHTLLERRDIVELHDYEFDWIHPYDNNLVQADVRRYDDDDSEEDVHEAIRQHVRRNMNGAHNNRLVLHENRIEPAVVLPTTPSPTPIYINTIRIRFNPDLIH